MTRTIPALLSDEGVPALVELLRARGWTPVAPTVHDGAVVLTEIASAEELPRGTGDEQAPGRYRLRVRDDGDWFGFAAPANSWKAFLHPPVVRQAVAEAAPVTTPKRHAFIGARACELAAIAVQDRVLRDGHAADADYAARRDATLVVAVSCAEPASVCFCESMGTGPRPRGGYDVLLTEIGPDRLLAEAGSPRGEELLDALGAPDADAADLTAANAVTERAIQRMRSGDARIDPQRARETLRGAREHPHWQDVALRCLACGNCTLVCPTCFCTDVVDGDDVSGERAHRERRWASCFSLDFSSIHGGAVRASVAARYRQWLTHKLSTWWDQFDSSGCVGCGRCITWCPVGIDLRAEVAALSAEDAA